MAETAQERAAKEFERRLKQAQASSAKSGGSDAQSKAAAEFDRRMRAAGGGGGGGDRNLLQQVGHIAKSPLRAGGRVLASGPAQQTFDILGRPGQAVKGLAVGHGPEESLRMAWRGFTGKEEFTAAQAIDEATGGVVTIPDKGVPNFVAEVLLDPLSYVSFGAGSAGKQALRNVSEGVSKEAAGAVARHGLKGAVKRGLVDPDTIDAAIRAQTAGQKGSRLARGGPERIAERQLTALERRGAGGMAFAGRTVIPGQSVLGKAGAAPFKAVGYAARPVTAAVRSAVKPRAGLIRAAGEDAATLFGEAESVARALPENVGADLSREVSDLIKTTKATDEELAGIVRDAMEMPVAVPPRLEPLVTRLRQIRSETVDQLVKEHAFNPAHLHDQATYLSRNMTKAGLKRLKQVNSSILDAPSPFARATDIQRSMRQGGSTMARSFMPDAGLREVEEALVRLHGPLPKGQTYLEHNAAKLVVGRAIRGAKAVGHSRLADKAATIKDEAGRPLVTLGPTRTQKAVSKEQQAAQRQLGVLEKQAAKQAEKAAQAADQLTSAQDLAVAARVAPPASARALPSVEPLVSRTAQATERALPQVEQRAVAASKASAAARDASRSARAARSGIAGDAWVTRAEKAVVESSRAARKAEAAERYADELGEYDRLYGGGERLRTPPPRKRVGTDPITRKPIYQRGGEWDWWDRLPRSEQARLVRNGWVVRSGVGPDELEDMARRSSPEDVSAARGGGGGHAGGTTEAMERWVEHTRRIDEAKGQARTGGVGRAEELARVREQGPPTPFDQPGYGAYDWAEEFESALNAVRSAPKGSAARAAAMERFSAIAPRGLNEEAAGKTFGEAFEVAARLAKEQAAATFTPAGRLSSAERRVAEAVRAGSPEGLSNAQRPIYDAVVKAAAGEAADTRLGQARIRAVDRITAAVRGEAEKVVGQAARQGERQGKLAGRQAGREMATAQLKRTRAAQVARAESQRTAAVHARMDKLRTEITKLDEGRIVTETAKEGYVPVQVGERTVYALPEVAKELQRGTAILNDDDAIRGFMAFYDRVLNMGKGLATVPLVGTGFHARNFQGNVWNNFVAGLTDPRWYARAAAIQVKLQRGANLTAREQELVRYAREHGVFNRGAQEADLAQPDALAKLRGVGAPGKAKRLLSPLSDENIITAPGKAVGSAVENNARLAHFLWALDKMGDVERAAISVKKHLFDYGDLTAFERKGIKRVIPFWTFMRKNTPLQIAEAARQPGKFTGLAHAAEGLHEEYDLDLPPVAAVKALTTPLQPGGAATLPGLGLLGAAKSQVFGKTIPISGTENFLNLPPGAGSESRLETAGADLFPLYGKYGKVSVAERTIDDGDWLKFFLGLRKRPTKKS